MPGIVQTAAIEPRLTMWPSPRAFMPGTVAARQFSAPLMFTSISASMSSGAASHDAVERTSAEALLISTSASSAPSALSTASRSAMSSASGRQPVSRASALSGSAERATA